MINIADFYDHQEYPNVSGIVFSDGKIYFASVSSGQASDSILMVTPSRETTIGELEKKSELSWNGGAILGERISDDGALRAVCGEGDHGSDGFVAVICVETQKLLWIAAFDNSNPFDSVEFAEECIRAKSTLDYIWCFPLDNPCHFTVGKQR